MRLREVAVVLRKDGFFHYNGRQIKAVYPREGYVVMLILQASPIDDDFGVPVLVLSCDEYNEIGRKLKESDELTYRLRGKGWGHGPRPYLKLHDFL